MKDQDPWRELGPKDEGSSWAGVSKWDDRRVPLKDKLTTAIKGVSRGRKDR